MRSIYRNAVSKLKALYIKQNLAVTLQLYHFYSLYNYLFNLICLSKEKFRIEYCLMMSSENSSQKNDYSIKLSYSKLKK